MLELYITKMQKLGELTSLSLFSSLFFAEFKEPNHDDEFVGGAILVRLQAQVGAPGVRRRGYAPRSLGPHLEARHCPL